MKKGYLAFLILCLGSISLQAQEYLFEDWIKGKFLLSDSSAATGDFKLDLENDLAIVRSNSNIYTLPPQKIIYFEFKDPNSGRIRKFSTEPFDFRNNGYLKPGFFEEHILGYYSFFTRPSLEVRNMPISDPITGFTTFSSMPYWDTKFYLRLPGDKGLTYLEGSRKELFRLLPNEKNRIKNLMEEEGFRSITFRNMLKIVDHLNALRK